MTLDVACRLHGWVAVLGNVHIVAAGLQVGTLHAQTQGGREFLAYFLVEAQVTGCYLLADLIVAGFLLVVLCSLILAEVDFAQRADRDEWRVGRILAARHEAVANLQRGVAAPVVAQHLLGVVVEE